MAYMVRANTTPGVLCSAAGDIWIVVSRTAWAHDIHMAVALTCKDERER